MVTNIASPTKTVIRGDTDKFSVKFNDVYKNSMGIKVKTPINITGWVIRFTVRKSVPATTIEDDTTAIISKLAEIPNGSTGIAIFNVTSIDTDIDEGDYWYDIQFTKNVGTDNEITQSLRKGKYVIVSDITRTVD